MATDDVAARIEDLQFTLGEGPCVDVSRSGTPLLIADLADPGRGPVERWPVFLEGARAAGVGALFALPVRVGVVELGVIDLYRRRPGDLEDAQLQVALRAADDVGVALLGPAEPDADFQDEESSRASYRLEVHGAAGMMAVQLGVSIAEALTRLRATAYAQDRSINDVAADVVQRRLRFSREDA